MLGVSLHSFAVCGDPCLRFGNMFFASHTNDLGVVIYPHHAEVYSGITFLAVGVAVYYAVIKPYHKRAQG